MLVSSSVARLRQEAHGTVAFASLPSGTEVVLGDVDATVRDIEKNAISRLPHVACPFSQILVAETLDVAEQGVRILRQEVQEGYCSIIDCCSCKIECLGFDTETRPKFHKGGAPNPVALIQLASTRKAVLFRVSHFPLCSCAALLELLSDSTVLKVGVGAADDDLSADKKHARR